jgi:predicted GNAT family N-acyltransferase
MLIQPITWEKTIPIRHEVLWPNKPPEFCHVEGDEEAMHFGAFINDELVSVASIYFMSDKARLRKFATKTAFQHRGIGTIMLATILQSLKTTDSKIFWCDARETAINFYKRFDMQPYGERFYKDDVAYFKMQVAL